MLQTCLQMLLMKKAKGLFRQLVFIVCLFVSPYVASQAIISIIIDDIGNNYKAGLRAINLPGALTFAFLPYRPHTLSLVEYAHEHNKEIMLHLPMQSVSSDIGLGEAGLWIDMDRDAFTQQIYHALSGIPHVKGLNNHMGSLLTQHPGNMGWLMEELHEHQLYFVDSLTTPHSVAKKMAREKQVPFASRDIFLDHEQTPEFLEQQFNKLVKLAQRNGSAIGIGHPYPVTLDYLEKALPTLAQHQVKLVPVSEFLATRDR